MSAKRKGAPPFSLDQGDAKRCRQSAQEQNAEDEEDGIRPGYQATSAKLDPECGQRGAFPGLDEEHDKEQLFYGPASDGLEYLRMVRCEAKAVPKLLIATSLALSREKDNRAYQLNNEGGWYADGAYTAEAGSQVEHNPDEPDAHEVYYRALVMRFKRLRNALNSTPVPFPKSNVSLEGSVNEDIFVENSRHTQWDYCFRQTIPTARCLAMASQEDVILALSRLDVLFTRKNLLDIVKGRNITAWLWSLLARCREVGQMGSDSISILRDLAKTAIGVGNKIKHGRKGAEPVFNTLRSRGLSGKEASMSLTVENEGYGKPSSIETEYVTAKQYEYSSADRLRDEDGGSEGFKERVSAEPDLEQLEKTKQALLERFAQMNSESSLDSVDELANDQEISEESVHRALAAVDMIVTLVGEVFGQRDLLDRRVVW